MCIGYDYIACHIDDFIILADRPEKYMAELRNEYVIKNESSFDQTYYLGLDVTKLPKGPAGFKLGSQTYLKEALRKAANIYGCLLYTSPSPRDQRGSRMPSSA